MTKVAVVFSGRNGLDFADLRAGVMRIPEVTLRLREAQQIIDGLEHPAVDLLSLLTAENEFFFRNIQLKSLVSAIVQVGLFDRFLKTQSRPQFLVGNSNGDSALRVCSGEQSFKDMVTQSLALGAAKPAQTEGALPMTASAVPVLSGLSLTEYHALDLGATSEGQAYAAVPGGAMELTKLVSTLFHDHGVARYVNIGPASALSENAYRLLSDGEIEAIDSIELDPLLAWFWRGDRLQSLQLAQ